MSQAVAPKQCSRGPEICDSLPPGLSSMQRPEGAPLKFCGYKATPEMLGASWTAKEMLSGGTLWCLELSSGAYTYCNSYIISWPHTFLNMISKVFWVPEDNHGLRFSV